MLETLKGQVVIMAKETERLGMRRHKSGNFSIFDSETEYVVIMSNGVARDVLGTEHVCVMDLWSKVIERVAEAKPSGEAMMYLYAYKRRKGIRAIVHTCARYSTTFSIMNESTMPIVYECVYLGKMGTVPMAPRGRAGVVDLARKVTEAMKEYDYRLMESHGVIVANKDMNAAFLKTQCVGEIAEIHYITPVAGGGVEPHTLPVEELQKWVYPKEIIL